MGDVQILVVRKFNSLVRKKLVNDKISSKTLEIVLPQVFILTVISICVVLGTF